MQEVSVISSNSSHQNFRSKGTAKAGRIQKGVVQDAHKKILTSCIPSKFETIVMKNDCQKAFGTSTGRFQFQKETNTGPGSYNDSRNTTMDSTIYSKKGLGNGFVSKVERQVFQNKHLNMGPGPGSYKRPIPSFTENLEREIEQRKYITQFYRKQQKIVKKTKQYSMGPGDYSPSKAKIFQNTFTSAFVTKYQRDEYRRKQATPAPGQYENQNEIIEPKKYHVGSSWFCRDKVEKPAKPMNELIKFISKPTAIDSPPSVKLEENIESWVFKEGIKNRFGDKGPIYNDKILGPGHYPANQFHSIEQKYAEKNYVSSHVFMSETERQPYQGFEKKLGPNCIVPYVPPVKKDVHLNLQNMWV